MKRYNITVNGRTYDVAVDEVAAGAPVSAPIAMQAAPIVIAQAPVAAAPVVAQPVAVHAPVVVGGGTEVTAPMPGNIIEIKVKVGDKVNYETTLAVLEAMKMENDIVAPIAGTVVSINVKKGDSVDSGTLIAVIQ